MGTNLDKSSHKSKNIFKYKYYIYILIKKKDLHNFEPSLYEDMEQKRIEGIIEQEEEINSHLSKS